MNLLTEIDFAARIRPLRSFLEALDQLGIDPNDEEIFSDIVQISEDVCKLPIEELLSEASRSEWVAARDMMKGYGVKDPEEKFRQQKAKTLIKKPRIGLQSNTPQPGQKVVLANNGGVGEIVDVNRDTVRIKTPTGYEIETPLNILRAHKYKSKRDGQIKMAWVEQIR